MTTATPSEPLHVQFARLCMGWTYCHEINDLFNGGRVWVGVHPNSITEAPDRLPRVDLPGYDLMPWEEANRLHVQSTDEGSDATAYRRPHVFESGAQKRREAVLRVLIALFEAGKGVRP